jgi:DNA polymerase-3 subunit alpha
MLIMEVKVSEDSYGGGSGLRITAERILDLAEARSRFAKSLNLSLNGNADATRLRSLVQPFAGGACPVKIDYANHGAICAITLGPDWNVTLREELMSELKHWLGEGAVKVQF